jgi:hypothetical protein
VTGLSDLEQVIERLEAVTEEAREMARELHSAIKAARSAERDLDTAMKRCGEEIPRLVNEHMAETMKEGLESWERAVHAAIEKSIDRVRTLFDQQMNMALYGNAQGRGPSILDELRAALEFGRDELAVTPNRTSGWAGALPDLRPRRPR